MSLGKDIIDIYTKSSVYYLRLQYLVVCYLMVLAVAFFILPFPREMGINGTNRLIVGGLLYIGFAVLLVYAPKLLYPLIGKLLSPYKDEKEVQEKFNQLSEKDKALEGFLTDGVNAYIYSDFYQWVEKHEKALFKDNNKIERIGEAEIDLGGIAKGYALDIVDNIYKPCYNSCYDCNELGNDIIHNCTKCKSGFKVYPEKKNNCYVAFILGKIFCFSLRDIKTEKWKDIKDNRIGRLLPPYITKVQQKYAAYLQRQGLPRIPEEAIK